MLRHEIRLEIIKLTHTLGRSADEAVERARKLEAYVLENEPELVKDIATKKGNVLKSSDNSRATN